MKFKARGLCVRFELYTTFGYPRPMSYEGCADSEIIRIHPNPDSSHRLRPIRITNSSTGQHYRKCFPTISETNSRKIFSRWYQVIIFRLLAGRSKLREHLHSTGMVDSPLCPHCRNEWTVSHLFLFCTRFQAEMYTIKTARDHIISWITLWNLLAEHRIINSTVEFVLASGQLDTY